MVRSFSDSSLCKYSTVVCSCSRCRSTRRTSNSSRSHSPLPQLASDVDAPHNAGLTCLRKEAQMAKAKNAIPDGHHTVTPQLTLDNAAQAIDWYKKALGAQEVSRAEG